MFDAFGARAFPDAAAIFQRRLVRTPLAATDGAFRDTSSS